MTTARLGEDLIHPMIPASPPMVEYTGGAADVSSVLSTLTPAARSLPVSPCKSPAQASPATYLPDIDTDTRLDTDTDIDTDTARHPPPSNRHTRYSAIGTDIQHRSSTLRSTSPATGSCLSVRPAKRTLVVAALSVPSSQAHYQQLRPKVLRLEDFMFASLVKVRAQFIAHTNVTDVPSSRPQ
ncbi:hypothetical protein ACG7TL_003430 [Trametes sanguinea]